jgi:hypothetical protein
MWETTYGVVEWGKQVVSDLVDDGKQMTRKLAATILRVAGRSID